MRIVHVIDSLRPRRGGPPIVAASQAAAQAALGHDVVLVSYAHPDASEAGQDEPLGRQVPGWQRVRHVRLPAPSRMEQLLARQLRSELRAIAPSLDVAHLHRVWEPLIPAAAAELRAGGVPYVISPHGMLHPWSLAQKPVKKRIAMRLIYRRALQGAAAIHALNVEERSNIEALKFGRPIHVVPNGVWLDEEAAPDASELRRQWPQLEDHPFVLFLGRLHHKKGPDILVDAFAKVHAHLPQVRLVIAGDDSGARQDIAQRVGAAGLANHVILTGPLYGRLKRAALAAAACFCLPSRQEGFPVAVLEAMAQSTPVVISRECYMQEVGEQGAGLVVPLEVTAIADALMKLLSDEALRMEMGASARRLVEQRYTWPLVAGQMLTVYVKVLAR